MPFYALPEADASRLIDITATGRPPADGNYVLLGTDNATPRALTAAASTGGGGSVISGPITRNLAGAAFEGVSFSWDLATGVAKVTMEGAINRVAVGPSSFIGLRDSANNTIWSISGMSGSASGADADLRPEVSFEDGNATFVVNTGQDSLATATGYRWLIQKGAYKAAAGGGAIDFDGNIAFEFDVP
jgi:hypothetical protein